MIRKLLISCVLLLGAQSANAQLYPLFGPSSGIMKGNTATPQTSSALSSDVVGLFSGTCNSTTYLSGNGACSTPPGITPSGAANLVFATPNGSSGNASLRALVGADVPPINLGSTVNGGVLNTSILLGTNGGTSNGFFSVTGPTTSLKTFTFPNASATVLTSNAAVTVPQGGTGLATLTAHGVLLGEGTSNVGNVAAMSADTVLQGQGATSDPAAVSVPNCGSSTTALSYSTSTHTFGCQTITTGGTGTVTSITAGTGISASPGSPITSSGTLSVDQSFSPTWTGTHTFSLAPAFNAGFSGSGNVSGTLQSIITNTNTGTSAVNQLALSNNVPHTAFFGIAGGGNTSAQWTGGPTGEQVFIGGTGNIPIVFGSNNTYAGQITGAGTWVIPGPITAVSSTVSIGSGVATTVYTPSASVTQGPFLVYCGTNSASNALAVVFDVSGGLSSQTLTTAGTTTVSVSGGNIQCTQTVGGTQTIAYSVFRMGR